MNLLLLPLAFVALQGPNYRLDWEKHEKATSAGVSKPWYRVLRREIDPNTKDVRLISRHAGRKEVYLFENGNYSSYVLEAGKRLNQNSSLPTEVKFFMDLHSGKPDRRFAVRVHATARKVVAGVRCRKEQIDVVSGGLKFHAVIWAPADASLRARIPWLERTIYEVSKRGVMKFSSRETMTRVIWGS